MGMSPETRLKKSDAQLVVCLHTGPPPRFQCRALQWGTADGYDLYHGGAGTTESFGDIDFLANGGLLQPGCGRPVPIPPLGEALSDFLHFDCELLPPLPSLVSQGARSAGSSVMSDFVCPHDRADEYFITALANEAGCKFEAFPCNSSDAFAAAQCVKVHFGAI